jgi:hypothetical protein
MGTVVRILLSGRLSYPVHRDEMANLAADWQPKMLFVHFVTPRSTQAQQKGGSGGLSARLGEGEVGGDAIDADALGDGVKGVAQAPPLSLLTSVQHPAFYLVEQARPGWLHQHNLHSEKCSPALPQILL